MNEDKALESVKGPLHVGDAMTQVAEAAQQVTKLVKAISERGLTLSLTKMANGYGVMIKVGP